MTFMSSEKLSYLMAQQYIGDVTGNGGVSKPERMKTGQEE